MSHYCHEGVCLKIIPDDRDYCPEHELHYDQPAPGHHVCQFTIPVEWVYQIKNTELKAQPFFIEKKAVSKLRCVCGKETKR